MEDLVKGCGAVLFTTIRHITGNISNNPAYNEQLPTRSSMRKKRKRRSPPARKPNAFAVGFIRLAKYGLLMWLIAAGIFLVLQSSVDLALDFFYERDDIAELAPPVTPQVASSTGDVSAPENVPSASNPTTDALAPTDQVPRLSKVMTIEEAIPYEVTAHGATLWHAIEGSDEDDKLSLQYGAVVNVIDMNGEWLHVRTEAGLTGFVHRSMVAKQTN